MCDLPSILNNVNRAHSAAISALLKISDFLALYLIDCRFREATILIYLLIYGLLLKETIAYRTDKWRLVVDISNNDKVTLNCDPRFGLFCTISLGYSNYNLIGYYYSILIKF